MGKAMLKKVSLPLKKIKVFIVFIFAILKMIVSIITAKNYEDLSDSEKDEIALFIARKKGWLKDA